MNWRQKLVVELSAGTPDDLERLAQCVQAHVRRAATICQPVTGSMLKVDISAKDAKAHEGEAT